MKLREAKIALIFDWMTNQGGAERVNLKLHQIFPNAPIYTSIYNPSKLQGFENAKIHTSFIQRLPFSKKKHQLYLSLMPYAYELMDLSSYDIVISSSHACAKGVITKPETLHLCYCHTPMRYAWDNWLHYISEYKVSKIIKFLGKLKIHKLRLWDRVAADRVDCFVANSVTTQKRIFKYYRKDSKIITPSIETSKFHNKESKGYFLAVGRLTPYKKFELIVKTFNKLGLPIKIAGTGILEEKLRREAKENVEILGAVSEEELIKLYAECEALIFPQLEDFGITPLEAMASGKPVIAYNKGGSQDTIIENQTGIFFEKQTVSYLKNAVEKYLQNKKQFNPQTIIAHSKNFDHQNFEKQFLNNLEEEWENWQART